MALCPCGSAFPVCFGWAGFMKQCNKHSLQALESLQGRQTFCTFDSKLPPFLSKPQGPRQSHWRDLAPQIQLPPVAFQFESGRWARRQWCDLTFGIWFQSTYLSLRFYCSCTFSEPLSSIPAFRTWVYAAKLPLSLSHTFSFILHLFENISQWKTSTSELRRFPVTRKHTQKWEPAFLQPQS